MHPRAPSVGEPVSRLALQAAISVLPCWSKAGSSAILRPSVLTHAISAIGGVVTMGGVVAQPNNGISMAVKHNGGIHRHIDITGTIFSAHNPALLAFQQKLAKRADLFVFPNLIAAAIRRKQVSGFLERSSIVPVAQYFGPHFIILPDTVVLSNPGNLGKHSTKRRAHNLLLAGHTFHQRRDFLCPGKSFTCHSWKCSCRADNCYHVSSSSTGCDSSVPNSPSNAFASLRSRVSNPSVNHP